MPVSLYQFKSTIHLRPYQNRKTKKTSMPGTLGTQPLDKSFDLWCPGIVGTLVEKKLILSDGFTRLLFF